MDINKQIYSECFNPTKVRVYSAIEKCKKDIYVPCGKCYHCLITRVNEWVTRMIAQSMFNKNTYYVTLSYDSALYGTEFFAETQPVEHAFNMFHKKQIAPLVLNKSHLQKFFKRLRKNTKTKFQYFACGEYGGKFGRPHYHFILWTDDVLNKSDIEFSWSLDLGDTRKLIGDVDFQDLNKDSINPNHAYKYVCKYLQKRDFDFNKIPTKKYHYENYSKNFKGITMSAKGDFRDYCKMFSPFFLCSKRPAIGYRYFQENEARFKKGNFDLYKLPIGSVFPSYYYRKTKESFCPYKVISPKNGKPNSFANIPNVVSMLLELQDCIEANRSLINSDKSYEWCNVDNFEWRYEPEAVEQGCDKLSNGEIRQDVVRFVSKLYGKQVIPKHFFDFYDTKNKITYSLAGDFQYNVIDSNKNLIYRVPISTVVQEVLLAYDNLLDNFLYSQFVISQSNLREKNDLIVKEYGSIENYLEVKRQCVKNLIAVINSRQHLYNLSKNKF